RQRLELDRAALDQRLAEPRQLGRGGAEPRARAREGDGAVQGAGVEDDVSEPLRDLSRYRRLPRPRGPVDGDDRLQTAWLRVHGRVRDEASAAAPARSGVDCSPAAWRRSGVKGGEVKGGVRRAERRAGGGGNSFC